MNGAAPALLTSTSTVPKAPIVASTSAWTWAGSVTSVGTATARPPADWISFAARSRASGLRAARATDAPAAANAVAMARPMPRLPPVTMATWPSSEKSGTPVGAALGSWFGMGRRPPRLGRWV